VHLMDGHHPAPGAPAIRVSALRKIYQGGVEAVKGIDFDVAPGEVFALLGPNGAGKSTTVGMLTTTMAPTSGTARLAGLDGARVAPGGAVPRRADGRAGSQDPARAPGRHRGPVIAPALKAALGGLHSKIDYTAFVSVATVGLLVPFAATFAGLSVIVDRSTGWSTCAGPASMAFGAWPTRRRR
jgi:energy-coupling factor transporter ATP-binding protein EcfA2